MGCGDDHVRNDALIKYFDECQCDTLTDAWKCLSALKGAYFVLACDGCLSKATLYFNKRRL